MMPMTKLKRYKQAIFRCLYLVRPWRAALIGFEPTQVNLWEALFENGCWVDLVTRVGW